MQAVVDLHLAVGARESGRALARVAALPRVGARRAVPTRRVVRAEIQVCETQNEGTSQ